MNNLCVFIIYISISSHFSTFGIAQASLALLSLVEKILFSSVMCIRYTPLPKEIYTQFIPVFLGNSFRFFVVAHPDFHTARVAVVP